MALDISWMIGRVFREVIFTPPATWSFRFGEGVEIRADSVWRIVLGGHIALSGEDYDQQYGLPAPIDAQAQCQSLIAEIKIERAEVRDETRYLFILFESGARLEILPLSSGYESWQIDAPDGTQTIAQGGGNLVEWNPRRDLPSVGIVDLT